ncbi:hypothetical protein [Pedobacter agri]|uniref:Uncharacterized protein n=1 Tax=Pedobacter agri TaxID=454586 RepID=A0A9X3I902_9SPHI|nr:hypothetical protein [Pedobacter agri]MCX3264790.1 hypothetical protein [Pedobacter agri]
MAKRTLNYREESRKNWYQIKEDGDNSQLSTEDLKFGCILRIADSMELMAKDRTELERQNKQLGELATNRYEEIQTLKKAVAAYKGKWNKLKKQLAEMEAKCI